MGTLTSQHYIFDSEKNPQIFLDKVQTSGLWILSPTLYQLSPDMTFRGLLGIRKQLSINLPIKPLRHPIILMYKVITVKLSPEKKYIKKKRNKIPLTFLLGDDVVGVADVGLVAAAAEVVGVEGEGVWVVLHLPAEHLLAPRPGDHAHQRAHRRHAQHHRHRHPHPDAAASPGLVLGHLVSLLFVGKQKSGEREKKVLRICSVT